MAAKKGPVKKAVEAVKDATRTVAKAAKKKAGSQGPRVGKKVAPRKKS